MRVNAVNIMRFFTYLTNHFIFRYNIGQNIVLVGGCGVCAGGLERLGVKL